MCLSICTGLTIAASAAGADPEALPGTGTYFITSVASDEALQPVGATAGQNVLLYPFERGGSQKWSVKRRVDPATNKPTNKYTISVASEEDLDFSPHPVSDRTGVVGLEKAVFVLEPADNGLFVKVKNGDGMYVKSSPPSYAEIRFGPITEADKFRWHFIPAN